MNTVMAVTENSPDSFPGIGRYVSLIHAASEPEDLVDAMSEYLASWSKHKIENLQRVDGGWGPFDKYGQSTRLRTMAHVTWIGDTVRRQLVALKDVGMAPNPELIELDVVFSIAKQVVEDRLAGRSREDFAAPRRGAYP